MDKKDEFDLGPSEPLEVYVNNALDKRDWERLRAVTEGSKKLRENPYQGEPIITGYDENIILQLERYKGETVKELGVWEVTPERGVIDLEIDDIVLELFDIVAYFHDDIVESKVLGDAIITGLSFASISYLKDSYEVRLLNKNEEEYLITSLGVIIDDKDPNM